MRCQRRREIASQSFSLEFVEHVTSSRSLSFLAGFVLVGVVRLRSVNEFLHALRGFRFRRAKASRDLLLRNADGILAVVHNLVDGDDVLVAYELRRVLG